jgi:hypothetical protein
VDQVALVVEVEDELLLVAQELQDKDLQGERLALVTQQVGAVVRLLSVLLQQTHLKVERAVLELLTQLQVHLLLMLVAAVAAELIHHLLVALAEAVLVEEVALEQLEQLEQQI